MFGVKSKDGQEELDRVRKRCGEVNVKTERRTNRKDGSGRLIMTFEDSTSAMALWKKFMAEKMRKSLLNLSLYPWESPKWRKRKLVEKLNRQNDAIRN